ncbi:N-acetylglucosamine-specific PTS transporter subunit IIBC [Ectobacillus panaciterrae]|uniref:N-acetylglucosamine-specific PTS transporter subunit IIBC n=1 Tax=Ectobacillus panaciterrae TaxID=363872 RepID=UPI0003FEEF03|nr:N-acetylglucosamine-specific PTS transporter subunit IIBC [Ectobacillus panaciterrae]
MLQVLQRIGKTLMLPIAVLPAAGLLLRLGQQDLLNIKFMAAAGNSIFSNLALLFAIGIAVGWAKDNNGAAGLAGAIGYFVLTESAKAIDKNINMAVLGGIIAGIIAGALYNRFRDTKLPDWLGFFSGRRFVPIVTAGTMLVLGGIFGYVWPPIQDGINTLGQGIIGMGAIGAGLFGLLNRLLIPLGLHHILNNLFWFVFGEYGGKTGDIARFFAGDPHAGSYMTGFFPIMMFGLPAAAIAMIAAAKPEKRKAVTGMLLGLALTSFLTGITEPIEFSFMFLSPLLYGIHAVLTGTSLWITDLLGIRDGFTFSAGFLDYALNFTIAKKPILLLVIGLVYAAIYFIVFYFLIKALNLKTPGREDEEDMVDGDADLASGAETDLTTAYLAGLGGKENLVDIDNCTTRLRLKVKDASAVDEAALKRAGAKGVIKLNDTSVQVVVGTNVEFVAEGLKQRV